MTISSTYSAIAATPTSRDSGVEVNVRVRACSRVCNSAIDEIVNMTIRVNAVAIPGGDDLEDTQTEGNQRTGTHGERSTQFQVGGQAIACQRHLSPFFPLKACGEARRSLSSPFQTPIFYTVCRFLRSPSYDKLWGMDRSGFVDVVRCVICITVRVSSNRAISVEVGF